MKEMQWKELTEEHQPENHQVVHVLYWDGSKSTAEYFVHPTKFGYCLFQDLSDNRTYFNHQCEIEKWCPLVPEEA